MESCPSETYHQQDAACWTHGIRRSLHEEVFGMSEENENSKSEKTFTQEQVNTMLADQKRKISERFADYDDLKSKAQKVTDLEQASKSAEEKLTERIAALESELGSTRLDAMKARVQAKYKVSDEDAELFLTAGDAEGLEKQAKALADRVADRKAKGPVVTTQKGGEQPESKADPMRELASKLFPNSD